MGQVAVYLDDKTEAEMKAAVKASGISTSKWVANVIHEKARNEWPEVITRLAGAWPDFPTVEEIRHAARDDARREPI